MAYNLDATLQTDPRLGQRPSQATDQPDILPNSDVEQAALKLIEQTGDPDALQKFEDAHNEGDNPNPRLLEAARRRREQLVLEKGSSVSGRIGRVLEGIGLPLLSGGEAAMGKPLTI